jgi:uncharacterized protein (TIGR00369 family)
MKETRPPADIHPAIASMMRAARDMLAHEHSLLASLGLRPLLLGAGKTSFSLELADRFDDGTGVVHGGLLTIILDSIMGLTVFTALDELKPIATINLRTDFICAATSGMRVVCVCECEGVRNDIAYVTGRISAESDSALIAMAAGAFMIGTRGLSKGSRL